MAETVEITFKGRRIDYYVNPDRVPFSAGDYVIVEAERGTDMGKVAHLAVETPPPEKEKCFHSILRRARDTDFKTFERIRAEETEATRVCRDRIRRLKLEMKLIDTESQIDGNRMTFYFTAEQRVDFRELVKDLASIFKTRIELRQIGARDAAKRLGGVGPCGREYCCSTWLKSFSPVTLKMAKGQGLALAPSKISGGCGRLMCCLMYEDPFYKEMTRLFPKVGSRFEIEGVPLVVFSNDLFREVIKLRDEEGEVREYPLEEFPISPKRWGGAVRPRGAAVRGGEGSGCGKTDPAPSGMTNARGRDAGSPPREGKGKIPIAKAPDPAGAPFMHGGRGSRATPAPDSRREPAPEEMVRFEAQERRRADRGEIGSGRAGDASGSGPGGEAPDLRDSELVASKDPAESMSEDRRPGPSRRGRRGRRSDRGRQDRRDDDVRGRPAGDRDREPSREPAAPSERGDQPPRSEEPEREGQSARERDPERGAPAGEGASRRRRRRRRRRRGDEKKPGEERSGPPPA